MTKGFLRKEGLLFLLIILLELILVSLLIWKRRMPEGHDGFQYFTLQYYFLNNAVTSGELPQWMPFMTHGTIATWWYGIQAGLLQNVLVHTGNLLNRLNFLPIFHIGIFVDELLLLIGVWLLARRFFSSPLTVFFVAITALGSCIWVAQPWWNFHFYYAIPLILYFLHSFLESGKWRYCFLAGNLLALQMLGNLPYFIPVTSLVIFLYFLFYFAFNLKEVKNRVKALKWGLPCLICVFFIIASFAGVCAVGSIGVDQIVNYSYGRTLDGRVPLEMFLIYGGNLSPVKWIELFLGVSPVIDNTLYIGILTVPLIVLGLIFNLKRGNLHFLLIIAAILFFSMGTFVSAFFYCSWPFMKFFRHVGLVSPIVKLFLCFLAGFGFEALFIRRIQNNLHEKQRIFFLRLSVFVVVLLLVLSAVLFYCTSDYPFAARLVYKITDPPIVTRDSLGNLLDYKHGSHILGKAFDKNVLQSRLARSAIFVLISSLLIGILPFINPKNFRISIVGVALFLQLSDIYTYKSRETSLRTITLNEDQYKITTFQRMPYAKRRDMSFWSNNPRALILMEPVSFPGQQKYKSALYGPQYWSTYSFLFKDYIGGFLRTDHWLLPLDSFMRAYWGQSIHDLSIKPAGYSLYYCRLQFPLKHPAVMKIAGVAEDKIQFFSDAYIMDSDDLIVSKITDPGYAGDILFLSRPEYNKGVASKALKWSSAQHLSSNMRLRIPYYVRRFDSDNLEVDIDIQNQERAWMLYSDVWHPFWRATVNGESTQVFKANLAYKAIQLDRGLNKVHFYFKSNLTTFLYYFFGFCSVLWLGIIIWLAGKICFVTREVV